MKKGILFLTILLFASITLFPQNTKWVENEVIISLTDTLVDINTNNTKFSLNDIKTKGFIKSDKLQTYLFNNDIESIELHPLFSQLKNFDKEKSYKGHTIKNINDLVTAKIRYTNKKNIEKTIIELEKIEGVVNVSPNFIHSMEVIPNDYRFNYHPGSSPGNNWGFYNWVSPDNDINMETAWNIQ